MIRRYESRKLYDPEESRYVSLQELAAWIREGEDVQVVDNGSGDDVTSSTLAQIILDEGRSGRGRVPSEVLHDLVRVSGERLQNGVRDVQETMNRLMSSSLERLRPMKDARGEIDELRARLARLEATLDAEGALDMPLPPESDRSSNGAEPEQAASEVSPAPPADPAV
jgi:polyhydroxyalkanoate synthesis repressor PhaR